MLPVGKEKLEKVRSNEAVYAARVCELRARLGLAMEGGNLHGVLVPVCSRIRGEAWDLIETKAFLFCFYGEDGLEVVSMTNGGQMHSKVDGAMRTCLGSATDDGRREFLKFPTAETGKIEIGLRDGEDIAMQVHSSGDYEEVWVYIGVDSRPVKRQIEIIESTLADGGAWAWSWALEKVKSSGDPGLFTLVYFEEKRSS
jgi:hypothetical protein